MTYQLQDYIRVLINNKYTNLEKNKDLKNIGQDLADDLKLILKHKGFKIDSTKINVTIDDETMKIEQISINSKTRNITMQM